MLSGAPHPPRPPLRSLQRPEQGAHNQMGWPETGSRAQLPLLLEAFSFPYLQTATLTYLLSWHCWSWPCLVIAWSNWVQSKLVSSRFAQPGLWVWASPLSSTSWFRALYSSANSKEREHWLTWSSIWWCRGCVMMPARQRCVCMCVYMHVHAHGYRSVHLYTYLSHLIWQNYIILQAKGITGIKYYLM